MELQIEDSPITETQEETIMETPGTDETTQPPIGVEGDEEFVEVDFEEEEKEMLEDELRRRQKGHVVETISSLRMKPDELFRMFIPLCRLVAMPVVRPTLPSDIKKLEDEFAIGYRDGAAVFYVSTTNEHGETSEFIEIEMSKWDDLWKEKNDVFVKHVESKPALKFLKNLKFFVCDGNHRRIAWMNYIERCYPLHPKWHYAVDCIILDTKGRIEVAMQVMHDVNS